MRIEFIGLPGAGKTTLRKGMIQSLEQSGVPLCLSADQAYYEVMKQYGDRPIRCLLSMLPRRQGLRMSQSFQGRSLYQAEAQRKFLGNYGESLVPFFSSAAYNRLSEKDRSNVLGSFLDTGAMMEMLKPLESEVKAIFFDEGLVQKSFMFVTQHAESSQSDRDAVKEYIGKVSLPDVVIHVKTNIAKSHQRMLSREDGLTTRLQSASEEEVNTFLETAANHIDLVVQALKPRSDCQVIEVENDGVLAETIASTVKSLRPYL